MDDVRAAVLPWLFSTCPYRLRAMQILSRTALVAILLGVGSVSCGGGSSSPTAPSGTANLGTCTDLNCNSTGVTIQLNALFQNGGGDGSWTYTFGSRTVSGTGKKLTQFVGLSAGDFEISGQFTGDSLRVELGSTGQDSLKWRGPIQLLEGPNPAIDCLGVVYSGSSTRTAVPFKFKLSLVKGSGVPCLS